MKRLMMVLMAAAMFVGCTKNEINTGTKQPEGQNYEKVEVIFLKQDMQVIQNRSIDENIIGDIHFFMFGPENIYHQVGADEKKLILPKVELGSYQLYAFTNCDGIHAGLTKEQLDDFVFSDLGTASGNAVAMTCRKTLTVDGSTSNNVIMQLERAVAKVSFSIQVADGVDMDIFSVALYNVPDKGNAFPNNSEELHEIPGATYSSKYEMTYSGSKSIEYGEFYIPENCRGKNLDITRPIYRDKSNAPESSTYILIRGKTEVGVVDYWVFIGNDDLGDFNINRNRHYVYNVFIKGTNTSDKRVTSYNFSLIETSTDYHTSIEPFSERVRINRTGSTYEISLRIECLDGDWQYMNANGVPFIDGACEIGVINSISLTTIDYNSKVYYTPPVYTEENNHVTLRYIITDQYGYSIFIDREYLFANVVRLYFLWDDVAVPANTSVSSSNVIKGGIIGGGPLRYWTHTLTDTGWVTYKIVPEAPNTFKGLYCDREFTQLYSSDRFLTYYPDTTFRELYPKID